MSVIADRLTHDGSAERVSHRAAGIGARPLETRIVDGAEWDRTIAGFDEVCQEQLHAFAAIRWPSVRQEPVLFLLDGDIVGGALIMVQSLPLGLARLAVAKWAPMLKDAARPDADAIHAGMVEALIACYGSGPGQMLSILPRPSIGASNRAYRWLIGRGFRRGSQLGFPDRYIVNLRLSDEAQRGSLSQTWRRQLGKAAKAGLTFEHAGPERIADFEALYTAMTDRKQFTDHSAYETVPGLMAIDVPELRPELFFVRHEGELVYGAIIFKAGDRAVYLYGASNDKALPLRAGYFMHWHIIAWLRDHTRAAWYDLGGTDGFQGLQQFKKGMVGEAGVIRPVPPVANYAAHPLALLLGTGAFAARDALYALRRTINGWRNPKTKGNEIRKASDEAGQ